MANDTRVCILIDTHIDTGCTMARDLTEDHLLLIERQGEAVVGDGCHP